MNASWCIDESRRTYGWVMFYGRVTSHVSTSHVIWMSHVRRIHSHVVSMSHVTRMNESCCINESRHWYKWVMLYGWVTSHVWMSLATLEEAASLSLCETLNFSLSHVHTLKASSCTWPMWIPQKIETHSLAKKYTCVTQNVLGQTRIFKRTKIHDSVDGYVLSCIGHVTYIYRGDTRVMPCTSIKR